MAKASDLGGIVKEYVLKVYRGLARYTFGAPMNKQQIYNTVFPVVTLINVKAHRVLRETPTMPYSAQSMLEHTVQILDIMHGDVNLTVEQATAKCKREQLALHAKTKSTIVYNEPYWLHVGEVAYLASKMIFHNVGDADVVALHKAVTDDLRERV